MRKQLVNEIRLAITLHVPEGARLIVAESVRDKRRREGRDVEITVPVRDRNDSGRPYLPGSSLKGVLRSRAEYIANSLNGSLGTCHLFAPQLRRHVDEETLLAYRRMPCGHRMSLRVADGERRGQPLPETARYRDACPACQLFGHTLLAGRISVTDFSAIDEPKTSENPHIAVDRITSGVAADKLFQMEYVTGTRFKGAVTVQNFSLWQLGWLGFLVKDLRAGLITVGHKRTSGAGRIDLDDLTIELRSIAGNSRPADGEVWGAANYLDDATRQAYGYDSAADVMGVNGLAWSRDAGSIWYVARPEGKMRNELLYGAGALAAQRLREFNFAAEMQPEALNRLVPASTPVEEVEG